MRKLTRGSGILAFLLIGAVAFGLSDRVLGSDTQDKEKFSGHKAGKASIVDAREGHATLWKEPGAIENLDLFYGPGGTEGAPDASATFTFVRRSTSGTSKKIIVKDDKGRQWTVKFGAEARPETAATRILWAMGYHVDEDYFVKRAHIEGWKEGDALNVRFERNHKGSKEIGLWNWDDNPFKGTRELDGLKVLMVLMNNWDLKTDNNKVLQYDKDSGGDRDERVYYVSDLGASFGSTGSLVRKILIFSDPPAGSKGKPSDYSHQTFIDGVDNGKVRFHYKGKDQDALKGITVENAKWMGSMLVRLSEKQLADAFRAAGFDASEVATYVRAMKDRIGELQNLR
ncbi:MAG: hypothetical protein AABO41_01375 [Acidobacteriota bacterium]